jgi:hypothetical protein
MMCLLVIIDNLDIDRAGRAFRPFKADPPLVRALPGYVLAISYLIIDIY